MRVTVRPMAWRVAVLVLVAAVQAILAQPPASAQDASPFEKLAGRWVGEGRLGIRDGKSGTVEVQSAVTHAAGQLSGSWKELSRDWSGELSGGVTPNGFKVAIKGSELNANMDIIVKENRQIIEIQFTNSSLIGLTLVLNKG